MLSLVFTFEAASQRAATGSSAQLARALDAARAGESIVYAQVGGAREEPAQVAVLFSDLGQLDGFTARLAHALAPSGIAIAGLRPARAALCGNDRAVMLAASAVARCAT